MTEKCWKISGRVQGVGFRYWVLRKAAKIGGLSGYAMNHPSGDVLVKAVGDEDKLNQLFTVLHSGPLFSRVDNVEENPALNTLFPQVKEGAFQRI